MSKSIIVLSVLIVFISLLSFSNATLVCNGGDYNDTNHVMQCSYKNTGKSSVLLSPKMFNNDGLSYSLLAKPMKISSGIETEFKINIDVYGSTEGAHKLTVIQGTEKDTVDLNVSLQNDINIDTNIVYPTKNQIITGTILLKNNIKRDIPAILKLTKIPKGLEPSVKQKIITLKANVEVKVPITIGYDIYSGKALEYTLLYGKHKKEIKINLDKEKMPIFEQPNKITALFNLVDNTNSNTIFIIIDVILFIASIVLFTMFVGRLGKLIVKK